MTGSDNIIATLAGNRGGQGDAAAHLESGKVIFISGVPDALIVEGIQVRVSDYREGRGKSDFGTYAGVYDSAVMQPETSYLEQLAASAEQIEIFVIRTEKAASALPKVDTIEPSMLEHALRELSKNYRLNADKIADALSMHEHLEKAHEQTSEQRRYVHAYAGFESIDACVRDYMGQIEKRIETIAEEERKADYKVVLPQPAQSLPYVVTVEISGRTTRVVFSEEEVPASEADFYAYLRDETHFPERLSLSVVRDFLSAAGENGEKAIYSTGVLRDSQAFKTLFEDRMLTISGISTPVKVTSVRVQPPAGGLA
ncbi:MAG: hypothetical protein ABIJ34_07220 [archaeon]